MQRRRGSESLQQDGDLDSSMAGLAVGTAGFSPSSAGDVVLQMVARHDAAGGGGGSSGVPPGDSSGPAHRHLLSAYAPAQPSAPARGDGGGGGGGGDAGDPGGEAGNPTAAFAEMRPLLGWLQRGLPFLLLLLTRLGYQHRLGLAVLAGLFLTFFYANRTLKTQVTLRERRSCVKTLWLLVFLAGNVAFLYYTFRAQRLHYSLMLASPSLLPVELWDLLWIVGIGDFVGKFISIGLKCLLVALPSSVLPFGSRGRWYVLVEEGSQLYRYLLPALPWFHFLMGTRRPGDARIFHMLLALLYFCAKCLGLYSNVTALRKSCAMACAQQVYGVPASKQQCAEAGDICPICQAAFAQPLMLVCRHVLCAECMALWCDRERACPLCRVLISPCAPRWRDGSTSAHLQLY
ncbi:E3 ubiquitin-protein ligase RNFT2 [Petromyzon marinus]|uniref:E3 ubiquitin-protein ligase RNFT1 n=1 Tax=Petromyzon marinus TaxID=7757 RepID=A0AAJ7TTS2_PETMA|nr:E3 ubiquitin-protein ligase RNFT1 [Petromyzon marinus]